VNTNVYDRQLMADGRLLHHLGLMLQRDEHNVATPKPASFAARDNSRPKVPTVQSASPSAAALDGCSPNQDNSPLHRCAWCDAEAGRKPNPHVMESHGICAKHLAQTRANLEQLRRIAA